jgi:hypothetical protein
MTARHIHMTVRVLIHGVTRADNLSGLESGFVSDPSSRSLTRTNILHCGLQCVIYVTPNIVTCVFKLEMVAWTGTTFW